MSRRRKIKIQRSDYLRTLLTETLPYEVPLPFGNEGLYWAAKRNDFSVLRAEFGLNILDADKGDKRGTVPYIYDIRKSPTEVRSLAVMHPRAQLRVVELYRRYDELILALCGRSKWTLRAPSAVASHFVERHRAEGLLPAKEAVVEQQGTGFDTVSKTASSYFVYRTHNLLYKFYESTEFHSLERRFRLLRRLDVSQCFQKIYTHTIEWAVKSREYAKQHLGGGAKQQFESYFDSEVMQFANHRETAGILIGPEVSRIFAEIILQRIDLHTEEALFAAGRAETDYAVRRYVDDYFVFANSDAVLDEVQMVLARKLADYKLSLNLAKVATSERPFSTNETAARIDVSRVLSSFFEANILPIDLPAERSEKDLEMPCLRYRPKYIRDGCAAANVLIRDIKRALKSSGLGFDATSNYFLVVAKRQFIRYIKMLPLKMLDERQKGYVAEFLLVLLRTIFFFFAMAPRVRQTYIVAQISLLISNYVATAGKDVAERVRQCISDEIKSVILSPQTLALSERVETLNLLVALRALGTQYQLSEDEFLLALGVSQRSEVGKLGYFGAMTALYYVGGEARFQSLRDELSRAICERFASSDDWQYQAEMVLLFFDFIRCPHVLDVAKTRLAKQCLSRISSSDLNAKAGKLVRYVGSRDWFFAWSHDVSLADILHKKELRTPY